ncbi:MAG: putative selenate reductase subunit YgfK, partial [Oscillibacter sp.]|nr:putative selenate reductase subunit YgfK [Oscillibacter sp.]
MSDIMRPIPFGQLMDWALGEYHASGTVFGVPKGPAYGGTRPIFGERVEVPLGPAAGPHTQLAQNIVAAYVAGARFFELKTVQIMDGAELSKCVPKPCITAGDEGYNCEWSTELTVPQAFDEYVKAWFACKLLSRELDLGPSDGFVFNMSVGYDLAGIKSPKIDKYLTEMTDAGNTPSFRACRDWAMANLDRFQKADAAFVESVPAAVSRSVTESTLH